MNMAAFCIASSFANPAAKVLQMRPGQRGVLCNSDGRPPESHRPKQYLKKKTKGPVALQE